MFYNVAFLSRTQISENPGKVLKELINIEETICRNADTEYKTDINWKFVIANYSHLPME